MQDCVQIRNMSAILLQHFDSSLSRKTRSGSNGNFSQTRQMNTNKPTSFTSVKLGLTMLLSKKKKSFIKNYWKLFNFIYYYLFYLLKIKIPKNISCQYITCVDRAKHSPWGETGLYWGAAPPWSARPCSERWAGPSGTVCSRTERPTNTASLPPASQSCPTAARSQWKN